MNTIKQDKIKCIVNSEVAVVTMNCMYVFVCKLWNSFLNVISLYVRIKQCLQITVLYGYSLQKYSYHKEVISCPSF